MIDNVQPASPGEQRQCRVTSCYLLNKLISNRNKYPECEEGRLKSLICDPNWKSWKVIGQLRFHYPRCSLRLLSCPEGVLSLVMVNLGRLREWGTVASQGVKLLSMEFLSEESLHIVFA